jgi:hypothetical protein
MLAKHGAPWLYWELYIILTLAVFVVCRVISPKFLITRVFFGTFALLFITFSSWVVIDAIWGDPGCIEESFSSICVMDLPFTLLGLLSAWRFAIWHQKVISI